HALSLASVSLPVPIGSAIVRRYDFVHDPSTQYLVRVDAPTAPGTAIRQTTIGYVAVNGVQVVRSITDPDGSTVSYAPDASGQVAARVDRRGYTTSFQFDAARALTASTLDMAGTAPSNITHAFCASETYGLSGCAPGLVPSDS